jgi:hypothetical protein
VGRLFFHAEFNEALLRCAFHDQNQSRLWPVNDGPEA